MTKLITILIVASLAGCYGSQLSQLREENRRLRQAQADGWQPPGHPALPSQSPSAPSVAGPAVVGGNVGMVGNGQASTGAMIARRPHGVYMGTVGAQARQVTKGPKLKLANHVCDNGSRNAWSQCGDRDRDGEPDYDTYLAFQIDGQPVVCDSPYIHPDTGEVLLAPGQTCYVELGRSSIVDLTIKAYRNVGTSASIMLDAAPDASSHRTVDIGQLANTGFYEIDESRF